jgi:hypothetical protein
MPDSIVMCCGRLLRHLRSEVELLVSMGRWDCTTTFLYCGEFGPFGV